MNFNCTILRGLKSVFKYFHRWKLSIHLLLYFILCTYVNLRDIANLHCLVIFVFTNASSLQPLRAHCIWTGCVGGVLAGNSYPPFLKELKSRMAHLETFSSYFSSSSFAIRLNLNHPCSCLVYFYLFGVFYISKLLFYGFRRFEGDFSTSEKWLNISWHTYIYAQKKARRNL